METNRGASLFRSTTEVVLHSACDDAVVLLVALEVVVAAVTPNVGAGPRPSILGAIVMQMASTKESELLLQLLS